VSAPVPRHEHLREDLRALHAAALAAAEPGRAVEEWLRRDGDELVVGSDRLALRRGASVRLVALGKASCGMARAALARLGDRVVGGVVAHPHGLSPGKGWPKGVRTVAAGHPLPDQGSLTAGEAALELLAGASPGDVALVLVSGGGSALFEALRSGVTLDGLRELTGALQHAGADIVDLNVVRRALSRTKGGGLARAAAPARVVSLLLSDVIGDPVASIASGPTVDSPTGPQDALDVLARHRLLDRVPAIAEALRQAVRQETRRPEPGERLLHVVGSNRMAAQALVREAEARGFRALLLTDRMQGEAREVGRLIGGLARGLETSSLPFPPPACLVFGGETTVTVRGPGRGGRNLELALGAALTLEGARAAAVFSFATDGMDGSSGAAGALATGDTLARARALGLDAHGALERSDSAAFFEALGDAWVTGASGTNVNDLVVVLAYGERRDA